MLSKLVKWLKPKPITGITIRAGVPLSKYNILLDGLVSIADVNVQEAAEAATGLTVKVSSISSSSVYLTFENRRMCNNFIHYLSSHDIVFTLEY